MYFLWVAYLLASAVVPKPDRCWLALEWSVCNNRCCAQVPMFANGYRSWASWSRRIVTGNNHTHTVSSLNVTGNIILSFIPCQTPLSQAIRLISLILCRRWLSQAISYSDCTRRLCPIAAFCLSQPTAASQYRTALHCTTIHQAHYLVGLHYTALHCNTPRPII